MTLKQYLNDTYLFEASASVVDTSCDEKGPYVLLSQTVFYPQGGGQPSDRGVLKSEKFDCEVIHVRQVENEIRHYINKPCEGLKNLEVECNINQAERLLNARYHTSGHLLGNIIEDLSPSLKAIKGHSFPKGAYVEFQGTEMPKLEHVLDELRKVLQSDMRIIAFEIDPVSFEKKFYKLPYKVPENKIFRAVQIGEFPPIPCGGTHLATIKEIGSIHIGKIKAKKDILQASYELA